MEEKFFLNKIVKLDRIEEYTLPTLKTLRERYELFLEKSGGIDPDFPLTNFGEGKEKKIRGVNAAMFAENDI